MGQIGRTDKPIFHLVGFIDEQEKPDSIRSIYVTTNNDGSDDVKLKVVKEWPLPLQVKIPSKLILQEGVVLEEFNVELLYSKDKTVFIEAVPLNKNAGLSNQYCLLIFPDSEDDQITTDDFDIWFKEHRDGKTLYEPFIGYELPQISAAVESNEYESFIIASNHFKTLPPQIATIIEEAGKYKATAFAQTARADNLEAQLIGLKERALVMSEFLGVLEPIYKNAKELRKHFFKYVESKSWLCGLSGATDRDVVASEGIRKQKDKFITSRTDIYCTASILLKCVQGLKKKENIFLSKLILKDFEADLEVVEWFMDVEKVKKIIEEQSKKICLRPELTDKALKKIAIAANTIMEAIEKLQTGEYESNEDHVYRIDIPNDSQEKAESRVREQVDFIIGAIKVQKKDNPKIPGGLMIDCDKVRTDGLMIDWDAMRRSINERKQVTL